MDIFMPKSITEMCIIIKYIYTFVIYFNKIKKMEHQEQYAKYKKHKNFIQKIPT